ncbi:MAG TPA: phosphoribosyl-AMP cyclohydrolase [Acidimicrobiales bacterium]|nr:phosphoribosyl-AMP cyclohydrolase [Acidimicrobiales bacterium]
MTGTTADGEVAPGPGGPGFVATPLVPDEAVVAQVAFNADGLVPAVVQDQAGVVLMMAWMNEDALRRTLRTGRTWFWSRSRQELWCKGETSGDRQWVREARLDCDGDTVLVVVDQEGRGACHTGAWSCFARPLGDQGGPAPS